MKFFTNEITLLEEKLLALSRELRERDSLLRFSYIQLTTILDSAPLGIIIAERSGTILRMNVKASSWLGCRSSHATHDIRSCFVMHRELYKEDVFPLEKIVQEGEEFSTEPLEYVFLKIQGRKIPVALRIVPMEPEKDRAISLIFMFDESGAFELQQYRQEFTSILSHQLRAPLTGIRWWIEMLLAGDAGELTSAQAEFLSQSLRSSITLIELVNTMLLVTRFESKQVEPMKESFDLKEVIDEVADSLKYNIAGAKQSFSFADKKTTYPSVHVDRMMMQQTLFNLLYNAHQYGGPGCQITVSLQVHKDHIRCSVQDTGMGIPEHEQQAIFGKHFRASNAKEQVPEGTGLGLYLAKMMVESWGGKIWFESREGKGTTFFFTVPIRTSS